MTPLFLFSTNFSLFFILLLPLSLSGPEAAEPAAVIRETAGREPQRGAGAVPGERRAGGVSDGGEEEEETRCLQP